MRGSGRSLVSALAVLSVFAPREAAIKVGIVVSIVIVATIATIIFATITGVVDKWVERKLVPEERRC